MSLFHLENVASQLCIELMSVHVRHTNKREHDNQSINQSIDSKGDTTQISDRPSTLLSYHARDERSAGVYLFVQ